jgi:8-oxo-dGTP pyrophosphatase MutT (NUDIX family)/phosphohistidine phosphatase SixA
VTHNGPVLAAGAVCWRIVDGKPRILLVHRAAHADVSLPKGKLDPGETLPETAKREIREETGLDVTLGAPLGTVEYKLPSGRDKVVHYWSAEVAEHALQLASFEPNDEIASLEWTSVAKARKKLSYAHDLAIVDRFMERFDAGTARTFAIIVLRHGKAVPGESWDGADATRPLMQRGNDQALSVARAIAAFGPHKLISSTAVRCVSTIAPLAGYLGAPVKESAGISQAAQEKGTATVADIVRKRLAKRKTTVLCSHGPVIPEILNELAHQTKSTIDGTLRRAASLSPAEYAVVHVSIEHPLAGIVAVEVHGPALE